MRFAYTAVDASQRQITGVIKAGSEREALGKLHRLRYRVDQIEPMAQPVGASVLHRIFFRVPARVLALFFEGVAQTLRAGMTQATALGALAEHADHRFVRKVCGEMAVAAGQGSPLSYEMARRPTIFPDLYVQMVRLGEQAGSLDDMCEQASQHLRFVDELQHITRRATLYPRIILFLALIVMAIGAAAQSLIKLQFGPFLWLAARNVLIVVGTWYGLVACYRVLTGYPWFNRTLDIAKSTLPWVASVSSRVAYARFSRALATMYRAGVPMLTALELSGRAAGNSVIEDRIRRAIPLVKSGMSLSEALGREAGVPGMVRQMIAVGEQSGQLAQGLESAAGYYERDADTGLRAGAMVLGIALYLAVMGLVGYMYIATLYGYYSRMVNEFAP